MGWVNRLALFKVHNMMQDFLNKAFQGQRFSVVHVCTKSVYEVHNFSNSFSPVDHFKDNISLYLSLVPIIFREGSVICLFSVFE